VRCAIGEPVAALAEQLDLASLWQAVQANNPELREAAAELDAARGRRLQAGKYPNPRFVYEQDTIGASQAPEGNLKLEASQEFVTAGKRRLDRQVADRVTDRAGIGMLGRRFAVLSRVRRVYYDYASWAETERANEEAIASLEQGLEVTRGRVKAGRPVSDQLRIEALVAEARISLARTRASREGAWRQLLAEAGLPALPMPPHTEPLGAAPLWHAEEVEGRVQRVNTALQEAAVEVERTRLALKRAEAEAVPNVTVGAGYTNNRIENAAGAIVTVETSLPLWDRKQGMIREARAEWAKAQAALHSAELRLTRETAAAT
jgi:cobalt-zinc-cadmium efflux system outer membrane protein